MTVCMSGVLARVPDPEVVLLPETAVPEARAAQAEETEEETGRGQKEFASQTFSSA